MQSVEPVLVLLFSDASTHRAFRLLQTPPPMLQQMRNSLDLDEGTL